MQFGAMLEHSAASAASSAATGPGETRRDASTQCELDVPTTVSVAVQCDIDCQPFTIQPVATSTPMDSQRTEYSVDADHDDDDDDNDNEYDDNDLTYEPSEISDITYDDFENTCEYVHDHDLSDLADTTTDDIPVEQQINFLVMESELKKTLQILPTMWAQGHFISEKYCWCNDFCILLLHSWSCEFLEVTANDTSYACCKYFVFCCNSVIWLYIL